VGQALGKTTKSAGVSLLLVTKTTSTKEKNMSHHIHHVHVFASDIDASIQFYKEHFNGKLILDMEVAGSRNVFMRVGTGRIHFYDQSPKMSGRGSIHHFGIQTDDIENDYKVMSAKGISFKKDIADLGYMKYIMVPAPDDVLIELFEVNKQVIPSEYHDYFE
jgi:catechol 2,3-dioxygenase-like lactoylglutathione lyase family enzyme